MLPILLLLHKINYIVYLYTQKYISGKIQTMFAYVNYPSWIKPTVFSFLPIRWYAVMYIVAFALAYFIFRKMAKQGALNYIDSDNSMDLFLWAIIGLILGARIMSCLVYEASWYYWLHPWMIFWPFRNGQFIGLPGMSYHGGVIGAYLGALIWSKKHGFAILEVDDALIPGIPLGYTFGRLGNFFNGELWGRCTGSSFGMIFPDAPRFSTVNVWVREAADKAGISYKLGDYVNLPRHPSQLYEAFFEGVFLFLILYFVVRPFIRKKKFGNGFMTGCYLGGYGLVRFVIEYFREPDAQLGFIIKLGKESEPTALFKSVLNISMGQILCMIMILIGALLIWHGIAKRTEK